VWAVTCRILVGDGEGEDEAEAEGEGALNGDGEGDGEADALGCAVWARPVTPAKQKTTTKKIRTITSLGY
jgi:hypothetical protein